MPLDAIEYLVVEGPIGVGKTTLARRLVGAIGGELLLEAPMDNPFLPRFYENPAAWALSAQLSFLLQRAQQMADLRQADLFRPRCLADFMLAKDRIFAELTLAPDELDLYEQVYAHVIQSAPTPDVIVYLHAPVDVLLERIARRGIDYEQRIDPAYLQRLSDAYTRYFTEREALPAESVVIVNAADIDFLNRDDHFEDLLAVLESQGPGCHHLHDLSGVPGI